MLLDQYWHSSVQSLFCCESLLTPLPTVIWRSSSGSGGVEDGNLARERHHYHHHHHHYLYFEESLSEYLHTWGAGALLLLRSFAKKKKLEREVCWIHGDDDRRRTSRRSACRWEDKMLNVGDDDDFSYGFRVYFHAKCVWRGAGA